MTVSRRKFITAVGAATVASAAPSIIRAQQLENVNYLLPAPQSLPTFAPWVLAQHRGYYRREGLNVTFQAGKGGVDRLRRKRTGAGIDIDEIRRETRQHCGMRGSDEGPGGHRTERTWPGALCLQGQRQPYGGIGDGCHRAGGEAEMTRETILQRQRQRPEIAVNPRCIDAAQIGDNAIGGRQLGSHDWDHCRTYSRSGNASGGV